MASDLSKYMGNLICLWMAGTDMPSAPAGLYIATFDGDPKTSGTENTTTIRPAGRVLVDWDAITAGVDNALTNETDADFGTADADADVSHIGLCDAASAGNILASKAVVGGPLSILAGASVKFLAGDLDFTVGS